MSFDEKVKLNRKRRLVQLITNRMLCKKQPDERRSLSIFECSSNQFNCNTDLSLHPSFWSYLLFWDISSVHQDSYTEGSEKISIRPKTFIFYSGTR